MADLSGYNKQFGTHKITFDWGNGSYRTKTGKVITITAKIPRNKYIYGGYPTGKMDRDNSVPRHNVVRAFLAKQYPNYTMIGNPLKQKQIGKTAQYKIYKFWLEVKPRKIEKSYSWDTSI